MNLTPQTWWYVYERIRSFCVPYSWITIQLMGSKKDEQTRGRTRSFLTWIFCFPGQTVEHLQHLEVQDLFSGIRTDSEALRSSYPILHQSHRERIPACRIHVSRALLYERVIKNWTKELFSTDGDETGARWSDERWRAEGSFRRKSYLRRRLFSVACNWESFLRPEIQRKGDLHAAITAISYH